LVIDDLLQRRQGPRLVELIEEAGIDHRQRQITTSQRLDLLDELNDNLMDYRLLFRQPLIDGYEELLKASFEAFDGSLPELTRDVYRSLYDLDRRNPTCERYRKLLITKSTASTQQQTEQGVPAKLGGKRIAIVGGHERTRQRVRERLHNWGVRIDEVPPSTSGRVSERDILDRVRMSDLIVLLVTYMGHDMSTIVNNLAARNAITGQVLAVECRGASGVTRAIARWSEAG
jgi:hypothetical protein